MSRNIIIVIIIIIIIVVVVVIVIGSIELVLRTLYILQVVFVCRSVHVHLVIAARM